jgi:hypothetical protein
MLDQADLKELLIRVSCSAFTSLRYAASTVRAALVTLRWVMRQSGGQPR